MERGTHDLILKKKEIILKGFTFTYDFGIKKNILRILYDWAVTLRLPANYPFEEENHPDGIFLSNGPGDPSAWLCN